MSTREIDIALIAHITKSGQIHKLEVNDHTVSTRIIKKAAGNIWKELRKQRRAMGKKLNPKKFGTPTLREQEKVNETPKGDLPKTVTTGKEETGKTKTAVSVSNPGGSERVVVPPVKKATSSDAATSAAKLTAAMQKANAEKNKSVAQPVATSKPEVTPAPGIDTVIEQS